MAAAAAATTTSFLLILLLFFVFSSITTAQQRNSNISIGSSLSPNTNTTSWVSPSGRFAFGFYPQDEGRFVIGVWFAGIPQKTVVWTANLDYRKVSATAIATNATLKLILTSTRGLILQYSGQGYPDKVIIETSEQTASYASMLDTGNMVIYNSKSDIIWQSFDSPTNTILQGNRLRTDRTLVSSVSETDYSKGRFKLSMQTDGNLVQYPIPTPTVPGYAYWATDTYLAGDNVSLSLNNDGHLYLFKGNTSIIIKNLTSASDSRISAPNNETIFYRLTLDVDGILRLYSHTMDRNGNWSINWTPTSNKCAPIGLCGLNGYCTPKDNEAYCNCLPGFNFIDPAQQTLGCGREANVQICGRSEEEQRKYTMLKSVVTTLEERSYASLTPTTEEKCKEACLSDCNCEAVVFESQNCRKQKLPLSYARSDKGNMMTFFKVSGNTNTTNATTSTTTSEVMINKESKKELHLGILIASLSFFSCAFIVLGISSVLIYRHRAWSRYMILEQGNNIGLNYDNNSLRSFTYGELEKATDGFKEIVGRGSFGTVFKGALSNSKRLIAVKRLEKLADDGEREFQAEMRTIGRTHHKNLVQLLGYCHEGTNRLLVYEYMSNGSLADFLFRYDENPPSWNERVQTALNIARGILYLHEECETQIIHCDIKPQNILMDEYNFAKIADFGLAKLLKHDQTNTYTGIRGTRGYVAPEWHRNMPITVKADVYSFGIVLLEIICCRRSLDVELHDDEIVLVDWVFKCFDTGELGKLLVIGSDEDVDMRRFERMIRVAFWCIQDEPSMRPSIKKVVLMLEGTIDIPIPPSPTSFLSSI